MDLITLQVLQVSFVRLCNPPAGRQSSSARHSLHLKNIQPKNLLPQATTLFLSSYSKRIRSWPGLHLPYSSAFPHTNWHLWGSLVWFLFLSFISCLFIELLFVEKYLVFDSLNSLTLSIRASFFPSCPPSYFSFRFISFSLVAFIRRCFGPALIGCFMPPGQHLSANSPDSSRNQSSLTSQLP